MSFVALTPASQRPYADGSGTNSIYHQVFVYNGFSRVGQKSSSPDELLGDTLGTAIFTQASPPPAWNRLLTASYGRDTGWLLPAAAISAIAIVVARRRAPRTDPWRGGALLWGVWLIVLGIVFSVSTTMNSYYAGALSPAVAGLLGLGGALAWAHRGRQSVVLLSAGTVLITVGYATWLLPPRGNDSRRGWPPLLWSSDWSRSHCWRCWPGSSDPAAWMRGRARPWIARSKPAHAPRPLSLSSPPRWARWPSCSCRRWPRRRSWLLGSVPSTRPSSQPS